jgi:hypothetical protein
MVASTACANGRDATRLTELPRAAYEALADNYHGLEIVQAWRETENEKECYLVSAKYNGETMDVYVSPDGAAITAYKRFILSDWLAQLKTFVLVFLLPGSFSGYALMCLIQICRPHAMSVSATWLAVWTGATCLVFSVSMLFARLPNQRDAVVIVSRGVTWGVISASLVEATVLSTRLKRNQSAALKRGIMGFGILALVMVLITMPLERLCVERENSSQRELVMRPRL